jgi:hypothetical protein
MTLKSHEINHKKPQTQLVRYAEFPLHLAVKSMINHVKRSHVDRYLNLVQHLATHKGNKYAVGQLKDYQLYVRQVTLGITPVAPSWHRTDRKGFPKALRPWKELILSTDHHVKQEINTLFGAVKLLKLPVDTSIDSVIAPFTGDDSFLSEFTDYCSTWGGLGKPKNRILEPLTDIPLRSTKGPNGPAVYTSLDDLSALKGTSLLKSIFELTDTTWCPVVRRKVDE